jgi:hypothetical protein
MLDWSYGQGMLTFFACTHQVFPDQPVETKRNTKQPRTERLKSCNPYLNHIWSDSSGMISETEMLDHILPQFIHTTQIPNPIPRISMGAYTPPPPTEPTTKRNNCHPNWSHQTIPSEWGGETQSDRADVLGHRGRGVVGGRAQRLGPGRRRAKPDLRPALLHPSARARA